MRTSAALIRTTGSSWLTLISNGWFSHCMRGKCGLYLGCTGVLLVDDSKAVALYLQVYLGDRESLIICIPTVKCDVPSNQSLTLQMNDIELEIDDDHPLALELSSLRTAIARFQVFCPTTLNRTDHPPPYIPSMRHILPHSNYSGTRWKPPWPSSALRPSNMRMQRRT